MAGGMKVEARPDDVTLSAIDPSNEVSMIEHLHNMAMSKDPGEAQTGRVLKHLYPALNNILEEEIARNRSPQETMELIANIAAHALIFCSQRVTTDSQKSARLMTVLADGARGIVEMRAKQIAATPREAFAQ